MPVKIHWLLTRPKNVEDRDIVSENLIKINKISQENDGFLLNFIVHSSTERKIKYTCDVWVKDNPITSNTIGKFFCSCMSFQYQYESVLERHGALYGISRSKRLPKKQTLFVCKHLEAVIKYLIKHKNLTTIKKLGEQNA